MNIKRPKVSLRKFFLVLLSLKQVHMTRLNRDVPKGNLPWNSRVRQIFLNEMTYGLFQSLTLHTWSRGKGFWVVSLGTQRLRD